MYDVMTNVLICVCLCVCVCVFQTPDTPLQLHVILQLIFQSAHLFSEMHSVARSREPKVFLPLDLSLCLAVSLSRCLAVSLSLCLSVFLSLCLSVSLSVCLSVCV